MTEQPPLTPSQNPPKEKSQNGCCGGPATSREDACCQADEKAKDKGQSGCDCGCAKPD